MTPNQCRSFFEGDHYDSPDRPIGWFARTFPSLAFYRQIVGVVLRSSKKARDGIYDDVAWHDSSVEVVEFLESVGCRLHVTGMQHLDQLDGPCIFIGNHMSTLETFVLPSLIMPRGFNLTYVVKRSLVDYPVFKHVMRSRNPVVVDRVNPRDDLKVVMEEGSRRLADGTSLVIFPQHTRSIEFQAEQFNSIGVKLARKADVPVVPLALLTWAWSPGSLVKDYGPIIPSRSIHFSFGEPLEIQGRGNEEHNKIVSFIQEHLDKWRAKD